MSHSTVSNLNKKIYAKIEAWRNAPIEGDHPYIYLDGIVIVNAEVIFPKSAEVKFPSLRFQISV